MMRSLSWMRRRKSSWTGVCDLAHLEKKKGVNVKNMTDLEKSLNFDPEYILGTLLKKIAQARKGAIDPPKKGGGLTLGLKKI